MGALRKRRARNARRVMLSAEGNDDSQRVDGTPTDTSTPSFVRQQLHRLPRFLILVAALYYIRRKHEERSNDSDGSILASFQKIHPTSRTFTSGPSVQVVVVKDFLPLKLAERWRDILKTEWKVHTTDPDRSSWRYATNNDGTPSSLALPNNQKTRSLSDIRARNATAHKMYKRGVFSYSKWELVPTHALLKEIAGVFTSTEMMTHVQRIMNDTSVQFQSQLSDLFVTLYETSDFLSAHDDGVAGTWAFVVSLIDGPVENSTAEVQWKTENGGQTRYECPYDATETQERQRRQESRAYVYEWCESIAPSFNSALLFRTRPMGPQHDVVPVSWKAAANSYARFGLTGWWMDERDVMNPNTRAERDKMRGRDQ